MTISRPTFSSWTFGATASMGPVSKVSHKSIRSMTSFCPSRCSARRRRFNEGNIMNTAEMLSQSAKDPVDMLVDGGTAVTMDPQRGVIAKVAIATRGDTIVAVGTQAELAARYVPAERLRADGQLILPGFINGHNHAPMVLFRGLGDDLPLQEWLQHYIFPAEA